MSSQNTTYAWIGWALAAFIGVIFVYSTFNTNSDNSKPPNPTNAASIEQSTGEAALNSTPALKIDSWKCVDVTSYNQNAYDDNKCTKGSETRYVSDSQAIELDSSYSPGKAGASYYNNR